MDQEAYLELKLERDALLRANHKLKDDIQCMVDKAAAKSLDGYRELGARAADAEKRRDEWISRCLEAEKDRDRWRTKVMRISEYFRSHPDKAIASVDDILET